MRPCGARENPVDIPINLAFKNTIILVFEQGSLPKSKEKVILNSRITKMSARATDQEFVEFVVKQIVNNPDDVKVDRKIDEMGVLITLDVNPEDMGMIIGREGATAKALRTLLRVIGAKNNARVNLKINEPEGSEKKGRSEKRSIEDVVGDINV